MVRKASLGSTFYSTIDQQLCLGGAGAIGLRDMPEKLANGEKYFSLGRFQDLETAKKWCKLNKHNWMRWRIYDKEGHQKHGGCNGQSYNGA